MTYQPPPPPPTKQGLPTWFLVAIVGVAVFAVVLIVTVLALTLGGDDAAEGDDVETTVVTAAQSESFAVSGEAALIGTPGDTLWDMGASCRGSGGYADIIEGAQVVVRDSTGKTVGVGALEAGFFEGRNTCVFPFTVSDVPAGDSIYSVEVSHRGEISFKQEDAGALSLTLG